MQITDRCTLYNVHNFLFILYSNKFYNVFNDTSTRSALRDWNNGKRFLIALSRSWSRLYLK